MLARKMWRDIRKNMSQFITIFLMIMIGVAAHAGIKAYMLGMETTANNFYQENNLEDLIVTGANFSQSDLNKILALQNVKNAERKLSLNASTDQDKTLLLNVIESNDISKFYLCDGEAFDHEEGVWLDNYYAIENNLKVGDEILIKFQDFETHTKIRGLINVPDHLYDVRDASELYPDRSEFGFAYISSKMLPSEIYNIIMVDVDDVATKSTVKSEILSNVPAAVSVANVEDAPSYTTYQGEIDEGKTYVGVFSGIFLFIALLSVITTMTRVIKKERTEIGTLKALGFSNRRVLFHYIGYSLIISIFASLVGIVLGYFLIGGFFMRLEMEFFEIPNGTPVIDSSTYFVAVFVILAVAGISYLVGRKILRENPAETLKSEPVKARRTKLFQNKFIDKLSFVTKWNLRDISRSKLRTLMGVAGVTGCAMMIVTAFGMLDSMNYFVDLQFSQLFNFDYKVVLPENFSPENLNILQSKYGDATSATLMIEIKNGDELSANNIFVTDAKDKVRFIDAQNNFMEITADDGIYLTRKLASTNNYQIGDEVTWHILGDDKYYTSKIVGFNKDPQNQNLTMNRTYLENLGIAYRPDALYTNKVVDEEGIDTVQDVGSLREGMTNMISRMKMMVWLIIGVAVMLGVVIIYNLGILSYTEKQYQFATLKVLGFSDRQIRKIFVRQNNWIAILSIILGLPLGFCLTDWLFKTAIEESYDFEANILPATYLIAAFGTFLVSWLVSLLLARKIKKIDMVSSLKADE